jgi:hypothetical protein
LLEREGAEYLVLHLDELRNLKLHASSIAACFKAAVRGTGRLRHLCAR